MKRNPLMFLATIAIAGGIVAAVRARRPGRSGHVLFVGTQGDGPGTGIFAVRLDERTGSLALIGLAAEIARPTWVLVDRRRSLLFAVSEIGNAGDRDGEVMSFALSDDPGRLRLIGRISSGGGGATHLTLAPDGRAVFVANFGGGQAACIPVAEDGSLAGVRSIQATHGSGPHRRQQGPHPHGVTLDPTGRFLLVPDMGADRVFTYRYGASSRTLTPAEPPFAQLPSGSGPRLLLFGRDGRFAYMLSELSAELYTFRWDAETGRLEQVGRMPLDPPGADGQRSAAALAISPDGRSLYASNRRTGAIHVCSIDRRTGALAETQRIGLGGEKPWAAELSPEGRWLVVANQGSDKLCVFAVDRRSGRLTAAGATLSIPAPTGLAFATRMA